MNVFINRREYTEEDEEREDEEQQREEEEIDEEEGEEEEEEEEEEFGNKDLLKDKLKKKKKRPITEDESFAAIISDGSSQQLVNANETLLHEQILLNFHLRNYKAHVKSPFHSIRSYLEEIERIIKGRHAEFLIGNPHICCDPTKNFRDCSYVQIRARIYRRKVSREKTIFHLCVPSCCEHYRKDHICDNPRECWHKRVYSHKDIYEYEDLYICNRSGRVHLCGYSTCNDGRVQNGGYYVCKFTGNVLSSIFGEDQDEPAFFDEPEQTRYLDAIDYEDSHDQIESNEDLNEDMAPRTLHVVKDTKQGRSREKDKSTAALIQNGPPVLLLTNGSASSLPTSSNEAMILANPKHYSVEENNLLRRGNERSKRVAALMHVIRPFTRESGIKGAQTIIKPFKEFIKNSQAKEWPGHTKYICRYHRARPKVFHPSWYGFRLSQSRQNDPVWSKIKQLLGLDKTHSVCEHKQYLGNFTSDGEIIDAAVTVYERLEGASVSLPSFEVCAPALLLIVKKGIQTQTGCIVASRKMEWFVTNKAENLVIVITDKIKQLHAEGKFGDEI